MKTMLDRGGLATCSGSATVSRGTAAPESTPAEPPLESAEIERPPLAATPLSAAVSSIDAGFEGGVDDLF